MSWGKRKDGQSYRKDKKSVGINKSGTTVAKTGITLMKTNRTSGFPSTNRRVGILKGWDQEAFEIANKKMLLLVQEITGHSLDRNNSYMVKESLNEKEYSAGYGIVPTSRRTGTRHSPYTFTGWRVNLPQGTSDNFDKKWEEQGITIKYDSHSYGYPSYVTIPASNPNLIHSVLPYLDEMIDDSLKQQALNDVKEAETKQMFSNRITQAKEIRTQFLSDLKDNGLESPSYNTEPYETENHGTFTSRTVIDIKRIDEETSRNIDVTLTMDANSKVNYTLGDERTELDKSQLIRILKIMKE